MRLQGPPQTLMSLIHPGAWNGLPGDLQAYRADSQHFAPALLEVEPFNQEVNDADQKKKNVPPVLECDWLLWPLW